MNSRVLSLIVSVLLVITLGCFAFYYVQSASTIFTDNNTITDLSNEKTTLQVQLAVANSQIADLRSRLNSTITQLTTLAMQLTSAQDQSTASQTQLQQAKAQIASVQSQLDSANSALSSSQSQVASLQAITNLSSSTEVLSSSLVTANYAATTIASFKVGYAGYVSVSGYSTSDSAFIMLADSFSGYPYYSNNYHYRFGRTQTTWIIPVLPGTVTIYFYGTTAAVETATVSVTYYY